MPVDHYVPQTHLRQFYSPALGEQFYVMRKSDLHHFTPNARGVCGIREGSTNEYLREDRAIEEFLSVIEPEYPNSIEKLKTGDIDKDCIFSLSGFVASIITCAPASMRIHAEPLKGVLEASARVLDGMGEMPQAPEALNGKSLSELIDEKAVKFDVDGKFPQAIGITQVQALTERFGNSKWEIIHNPYDDNPFFTSDFPIGIERVPYPHLMKRVVPLAPDLAIRICPDARRERHELDMTFKYFGVRHRTATRKEVSNINRLIVQCAEDIVIYRDDYPWVKPFIERNRAYRIIPEVINVPHRNGYVTMTTQKIGETIVCVGA